MAYKTTYEERLFSKGMRRWLHSARFFWLQEKAAKNWKNDHRIIELGCFNGKAIEYLPGSFKSYSGYDAGWEGGLDEAIERFKEPEISFHKCIGAEEFKLDDEFDIFISLETLEHVRPNQVQAYLSEVKNNMSARGRAFISVPNEIGLLFVLKQMAKILFYREKPRFGLKEFFWQAMGKVERVEWDEHKGFSYKRFEALLNSMFVVEKSEGLQFSFLPRAMNPSIGFVCARRQDA